MDHPRGGFGDLHHNVMRGQRGQVEDWLTSSGTRLPWRVVAWIVAVAGVADCSTTWKDAEMLPSREMNLAVGAPIVMLRKSHGLRSARFATIV